MNICYYLFSFLEGGLSHEDTVIFLFNGYSAVDHNALMTSETNFNNLTTFVL